jgi:hypothetical protein
MLLVLKVYILQNWRFSVIVIVGTLDTKGDKAAYLKQVIESKGVETFVIDCGVLGEPLFEADFPREKVAEAAGSSISELSSLGGEAEAIGIMAQGTAKIVAELYSAGCRWYHGYLPFPDRGQCFTNWHPEGYFLYHCV